MTENNKKIIHFVILSLLTFLLMSTWLTNSFASSQEEVLFEEDTEFLQMDEAFIINADVLDDEIIVRWSIADDYYLYKHRFNFSAAEVALSDPFIPEGIHKTDEYFGEVEVYYKHIEITVPYKNPQSDVLLTVGYQGCADAGLCYTPTKRYLRFTKQDDGMLDFLPGIAKKKPSDSSSTNLQPVNQKREESLTSDSSDTLSTVLAEENIFWTLISFLGAGLLLTFTPCVLPMIPILSGIIAGQGESITPMKAFRLSFIYVQAMAITYALLGILVAQAGSSLSGYLQSPLILSIVAVLFVLLALSMFGLYEISIPEFIAKHLRGISEKQSGGNYLGVAVMGVISTLIVSPCTTAPLTAALLFIANSGDLLVGGLSLYFLGLGMGIPLLIIGVSEGRLIPRAGAWMESIRNLFGFIMLAMALYITDYLIPGPVYLMLWGLLFIAAALFFGVFTTVTSRSQLLKKIITVSVLCLGIVYLAGGLMGNGRLLRPLENVMDMTEKSALTFQRFKSLNELTSLLKKAREEKQPVMVDFFAEWCLACYEFEDYTFSDKRVQDFLAEKQVILLQADVTLNSKTDIELMENYKILGLPSILFFNADGFELEDKRTTGYESAEEFLLRLKTIFQ